MANNFPTVHNLLSLLVYRLASIRIKTDVISLSDVKCSDKSDISEIHKSKRV